VAAKEDAAEILFERGEAAGDRCVVEAEGFGCSQNLAVADDGEEDADVIPIHRLYFLHNRCGFLDVAVR
jgi:hypothetical protein